MPRAAFVPIRLYVGLAFFLSALEIVFDKDGISSWVKLFGETAAKGVDSDRVFAFYKPVLSVFVQPNANVFAWAVLVCFGILGIALILGAFSRLAGAITLFLQINFMLARGESFLGPHSDGLMIGMELAIILAAAGRVWGIDAVLHRRRPQPVFY